MTKNYEYINIYIKFIIKYKTINFTLKNNYNTKQYKIITNINNQL